MKKFTCTGCNSVFYEGNVPAKCPICGCPAGFFKETTASAVEMIHNTVEEEKPIPSKQSELESTINVSSNAQNQNVVTILGYTEHFAVEKAVEVYKDGLLIGSIPPNGKMDVQVDGGCELKFKCGFNTITCKVKAGDWIVLSLKNQLKALLANQNNYEDIVNRLQEEADSSKRKRGCFLDSVLCIVVIAALGFFGYRYVSNSVQPSNTNSSTQSSYSCGNYGGLGGRHAVAGAIENYLPYGYIVVSVGECRETSHNVVEYECTVQLNQSGAPIHKGHGRLTQDASGRNVRGSFNFDD